MAETSPEEWLAVRLSIWVANLGTIAACRSDHRPSPMCSLRGRFPGKALLNGLVPLPADPAVPASTGYLLR